MMQSDSMQRHL